MSTHIAVSKEKATEWKQVKKRKKALMYGGHAKEEEEVTVCARSRSLPLNHTLLLARKHNGTRRNPFFILSQMSGFGEELEPEEDVRNWIESMLQEKVRLSNLCSFCTKLESRSPLSIQCRWFIGCTCVISGSDHSTNLVCGPRNQANRNHNMFF